MKRSGTFLTVLLIFIVINNLKAQTYPLSDFVETKLPKSNSSQRAYVFRSGYEFVVSLKNGKPIIRKYKQNDRKNLVRLFVDSGKLIGTDEGEFIGQLWFVSNSHDTTIIKKGDIRFLFKYDGEIYFIEGLAHLETDEGALYKIELDNNKYSYKKILDFDDAPDVMCLIDNDILAASSKSFYKIHNLKKERILPGLLADDFLPRSLAAANNTHVFMGGTAGYLRIDLVNKKYKYYRYNTSP